MYHLVDNFTNPKGDALVGYYVKLKVPGGAYAPLFADVSSTPIVSVSGIADTAITDSIGQFDLYVADGDYDIEFFDSADVTQRVRTINSVPMYSLDTAALNNVDAVLGVTAADGDLGTFTGATITDNVAVKPALQELETAVETKAATETLAATGGAALVGHQPSGTGATPSTLAAIFNRSFVWLEDYSTVQQAVDAAVSRGAPIALRPGQTYSWPDAVTTSSKITIDATGATINVPNALTALTLTAGADGSVIEGGQWNYTGAKTDGYSAASNCILATGTRNGAGVAPTRLEDVSVRNATFKGFGNTPVEYRFTKQCSDENLRIIEAGYAGVFLYSVDIHESKNLFVNTLYGQLDTGVAATSQLNAYGLTATALTGGTPDRVQDPHSRDISISNPFIYNVPTWHAIDSHGSDNMTVIGAKIIGCRRGVVFTGLTDRGTTNSKAISCTATNNFTAAATNANGTYQKGEAFWDIGPSTSNRNTSNYFGKCSCFGHGNPSANEGAVTIANADNGFYGIADEQSYRLAWKFGANISGATIDARTTNTRSATVNPSVARIDGNDIDLRIAKWRSGARDASVDTNVMINGIIVVSTNTGGTIHFEDFDLTDCTAGEILSNSGSVIAATLTGNFSFTADLTLTGVTAVVTSSVRFVRRGPMCFAEITASGVNGTSNTTACTLTGVPAAFRPSATRPSGLIAALDGSNFILAHSLIDTGGVITFTRDADNNTSAWTSSGLKGLRGGVLQWSAA